MGRKWTTRGERVQVAVPMQSVTDFNRCCAHPRLICYDRCALMLQYTSGA